MEEESEVVMSSVEDDRSFVESEPPLMSSTVVEEQRRNSTDRCSSVSSQTVKRYVLIRKTGLDDATNSNVIHVWGPTNLAEPVSRADKNETNTSSVPADSQVQFLFYSILHFQLNNFEKIGLLKEKESGSFPRSGEMLRSRETSGGVGSGGCGSGGDDGEKPPSSPLRSGHSIDDISMAVEDEEEEELLEPLIATPSTAALGRF